MRRICLTLGDPAVWDRRLSGLETLEEGVIIVSNRVGTSSPRNPKFKVFGMEHKVAGSRGASDVIGV